MVVVKRKFVPKSFFIVLVAMGLLNCSDVMHEGDLLEEFHLGNSTFARAMLRSKQRMCIPRAYS